MIPLVCEWSDEQDMAELLRMCDRGDVLAERRTGFPLSLPAEFDTRVAIATHDAGLGIAARYLHGSMLMAARAAGFDAGRVGVASNDHRQFVSAVRDRNPAAAESIMSRHLNRSEGR